MTEHKTSLESLNEAYSTLSPLERLEKIYSDFDTDKVLVTSSFGTTSVFMLHLISQVNPKQKVYFIDTGYHFKETIQYRREVAKKLGLVVESLHPDPLHHQFTTQQQTWKKDPNLCCSVNKVLPLKELKAIHDVWVSGLIGQQNSYRQQVKIFGLQDDILKFHPIVDQSLAHVKQYIAKNQLPINPLTTLGYGSIGCTHCTTKGDGRTGRWQNFSKTECGLHITDHDAVAI